MVEVAVSGVNAVVAVVVKDDYVAWDGLFDWHALGISSLLIDTVWKFNSKLGVDEKHESRAVDPVWSLATEDIRGSDNLGCGPR